MCWVTLDSTHLLDSKSNIQSLCMLDGFQDFVIWETHMRLALKLIELCGMRTSTSTRLLGSANVAPGCRYKLIYTKINISGYRPWQYHTQTLKGESVARKTCKDQKLLAERHLSSCWASSSQQIMLKQNIAQLMLCFVENYWTKTLHGLCCAHLRSGRDLSQFRRERSASAKLPCHPSSDGPAL